MQSVLITINIASCFQLKWFIPGQSPNFDVFQPFLKKVK